MKTARAFYKLSPSYSIGLTSLGRKPIIYRRNDPHAKNFKLLRRGDYGVGLIHRKLCLGQGKIPLFVTLGVA